VKRRNELNHQRKKAARDLVLGKLMNQKKARRADQVNLQRKEKSIVQMVMLIQMKTHDLVERMVRYENWFVLQSADGGCDEMLEVGHSVKEECS
jgi:hypothetical protein